jgi:hypothetical protein
MSKPSGSFVVMPAAVLAPGRAAERTAAPRNDLRDRWERAARTTFDGRVIAGADLMEIPL